MECLWYGFAGFIIGGIAGMLVIALMVMAREPRIDVRGIDPQMAHPFERTHPLC